MNIQTIELNADLPRNLEPYEMSNVKYYISNSKGIILMNSHEPSISFIFSLITIYTSVFINVIITKPKSLHPGSRRHAVERLCMVPVYSRENILVP